MILDGHCYTPINLTLYELLPEAADTGCLAVWF